MEPIKPGDARIRLYETAKVVNPQPTVRVLVDSEQAGPGNMGLADLLQAGQIQTSFQPARPSPEAQVLLLDGSTVRSYKLTSALGGATDLYLGAYPTAPAANPTTAQPLVAGNTYFNTTDKNSYVWNGSAWQLQGLPQPATLKTFIWYTATPQEHFVGTDDLGDYFAIDPTKGDTVAVHVNGAKQAQNADYYLTTDGGVTLYEPTCANAVVEITAFLAHTVTNIVSPIAVDVSKWVFDGVGREFPLFDYSGAAVAPDTATQCLVMLSDDIGGNRALNPVTEFAVVGATITFALAPPVYASPGGEGVFGVLNQRTWMVVGLPLARPETLNALTTTTAATGPGGEASPATLLEAAPGIPLLTSGTSPAFGVTAVTPTVNAVTPIASLPPATEALRGEFRLLAKDGYGDQLVICMKNADETYGWRPLVYAA